MEWLLKQKQEKEAKIAEFENRIAEVIAKEAELEAEIAAKKAELEELKEQIANEENIEQTKAELAEINSILDRMNGTPTEQACVNVEPEVVDVIKEVPVEEPLIEEEKVEIKEEEQIPSVEEVAKPVIEEKIEKVEEAPKVLFNPRDLLR